MGPILYTLFTNELPEIIQDNNGPADSNFPGYRLEDEENGSICCFADDSTLTVTDKDHNALTIKLTRKYNSVAQFMVDNRLKMNDDKTHLLVMCTDQTQGQSLSDSQMPSL